MNVITRELLLQLSAEARISPRQRKNYNLHSANESRCHRLFNAIEPAAYIRPHRHLDPEKDETFVLVSGRLAVITFSDTGAVTESLILSHQNGMLAADIPHGIYHAAVSLEPGTVFFEAKAGPYLPLSEDECASWAPSEGDGGAAQYLEKLKQLLDS
ncbi:MAG: WbuC family cupin fold metalloprotein [Verrucomicrobia bacterium]|nr:WbuC family cupin fold metalloprotein [Deltaproteobacteria bacterium]